MTDARPGQRGDSWPGLVLDVWTARALVWVARVGRDAELTEDAHQFFFDRYQRLAEWHRARGRVARARRLLARAEYHRRSGPDEGPPYAAAMAMPRPRRLVFTNAVGTKRIERPHPPDDAA